MIQKTKVCRVDNGSIQLDNETVFKSEEADFSLFAKEAYRALDLQYPKFHKMDNLSKLSLLATELSLKNASKNTALVLANRSASLDTDLHHQQTISDPDRYFPSPAVFVYTLPNICLGEISIRHQLRTENIFFVMDDFNEELIEAYSKSLISDGKAESVLCGWMELLQDNYKAFVYLLEDIQSE